jgi:ribose-phosphate pyrophosphokinase
MWLTLVPMPGNEGATSALARGIPADLAVPEIRHFPDGELYVRLELDVNSRQVGIVCTLDRPDQKLVSLIFLARLARDLGASRVGIIAPYLAYMRQDRRFQPGEAESSLYFADLLSRAFDWLVTVDPHLHRHNSLAEIYTIPAHAAASAPIVSQWIRTHVAQPALIGPDSESKQWVESVAAQAGAPFVLLAKQRLGDREVRVSVPDPARLEGRTPVLVDDIVSTGRTMIESAKHLRAAGLPAPVCIGIHAVFAEGAYAALQAAGAARIVTTNTIPHVSNGIDVTPILAEAVQRAISPT